MSFMSASSMLPRITPKVHTVSDRGTLGKPWSFRVTNWRQRMSGFRSVSVIATMRIDGCKKFLR